MEALTQMHIAGIPIRGIIQVGSSDGQERYDYLNAKIPQVFYIEAVDEVFKRLQDNIAGMEGHVAIQAVCSDREGETITFKIASNYGMSSSMLDLGYHQTLFPDISYVGTQEMITTTVDRIAAGLHTQAKPNLMVVDTQGADLKVLHGARRILADEIDAVYVELSEVPLYEGGCTMDEVTAYLAEFGFRLRWLSIHGLGHGDGFYCKLPGHRSYDAKARDLTVVEALALLTPYDIDKTKARIGPLKDGGYILVSELLDKQPILSYGIDGEYDFDLEMARRGHQMLMFDHTIDAIHNPGGDPKLKFVKEGVAGTVRPAEQLNTIANHMDAYLPPGEDAILKMDVEGYEYEALDALPEAYLRRFQQIVFEIHDLHGLHTEARRSIFVRVISKLNKYFTLFHVHANNFDGENTYNFLSGVPVANLLELSYVRSDLVGRRPSTTLYPTPLDYPNVHPRDKRLWFFPFLPAKIDAQEFVRADMRMESAQQ